MKFAGRSALGGLDILVDNARIAAASPIESTPVEPLGYARSPAMAR